MPPPPLASSTMIAVVPGFLMPITPILLLAGGTPDVLQGHLRHREPSLHHAHHRAEPWLASGKGPKYYTARIVRARNAHG